MITSAQNVPSAKFQTCWTQLRPSFSFHFMAPTIMKNYSHRVTNHLVCLELPHFFSWKSCVPGNLSVLGKQGQLATLWDFASIADVTRCARNLPFHDGQVTWPVSSAPPAKPLLQCPLLELASWPVARLPHTTKRWPLPPLHLPHYGLLFCSYHMA